MVEAGGKTILEVEGEVLPEKDATTILGMSLVEDRIRTQVSQVVTGLIKKLMSLL